MNNMLSSNALASFALVISLVSFWLSYITFRQNARRTSAKKRTEALSALRSTSMQLTDLLEKVQLADNTKLKKYAESHVNGIASNINNEMEKVRRGVAHDPVLLEHLKAYAADIGEHASHIAPKIVGALEETRLATVEQIEQVNAAVREAIESANGLLATVRATELPSEEAAAFETEKLWMEKTVEELMTEMTTVVNEILARDELYSDSAVRCKSIASEFTERMNTIQMKWKLTYATHSYD